MEPSRLRPFDLFDELSDDEIEEATQMIRTQTAETGTRIIRQEQEGNEVFLLEAGSVEIHREEKAGSHFVARLDAPACFGERALLDSERVRTATVTAATDVQLLVLRMDSFLSLLRKHPSIRERMRGLFAERI